MVRQTKRPLTVNDTVSRRKLLLAGSGAFTIGLAGCSTGDDQTPDSGGGDDGGDDGGDTSSGDDEGSGVPIDDTFSVPSFNPPGETHHNPYNPGQFANGVRTYAHDRLFAYNTKTGEWHERIGSGLSKDGDTVTLELNDRTWADGDAVTAEDVVTQIRLEKYVDFPIWQWIDGVEAAGEKTVELTLSKTVTEGILFDILNRHVTVKRDSAFADWLEKFQSASESKREDLQNEFLKFRYSEDSHDPVSNGPYVVSDTEEQRWVMDRNEEYHAQTNIPHVERLIAGGDEDIWQMIISERLDGRAVQAVQKDVEKQFPDWMEKIMIPFFGGLAPMINQEDPVFGTREFRKAMAYLVDRNLIEQNTNPRHKRIEQVSGLTNQMTEQWIPDFAGQLEQYGNESKPDMAAQKMREGGFEKKDGTWHDTEGEPIQFDWSGPPWPGPIGVSETFKPLLDDFGIEMESTTLEPPQFFSRRGEMDYDFAFNALLGGPHPFFFAQDVLKAVKSKLGGFPRDEVDLPPLGDPGGSQSTFDLQQMIDNLAATSDEAQLREHVKEYAWWFNQELPYFQMTNAAAPSFIASHNWEIPDLSDDAMYLLGPANQLFRETEEGGDEALIQAKTE